MSDPGWVVNQGSDPSNQLNGTCTFKLEIFGGLGCATPSSSTNGPIQGYANAVMACPPSMLLANDWNNGTAINYRCTGNGDLTPPNQCPVTKNPVQVTKGWKFWAETDFTYPIEFKRYYTSRADTWSMGRIGKQWRHTYERTIKLARDPNFLWMIRAEGTYVLFSKDPGGVWHSSSGSHLRLTQESFGYRVYNESDEIEDYDASGRLTSLLFRDGRKLTLAYDTYTGLITSITDLQGRSLTFAPTTDKRFIGAITDSVGNTRQYAYSSSTSNTVLTGISTVDAAGTHWKNYHYEASNPLLLTGITSETGRRYSTYGYDASGRVANTRLFMDATHPVEQYTYTYPTSTTTNVTTPLGLSTTYTSTIIGGAQRVTNVTQPCSSCGSSSAQATGYDTDGNTTSSTDFNGAVTTSAYADGERGLETERVEASNDASANSVKRTIRTVWDTTFRLPKERRLYNAGNVMEAKDLWVYNARGQVIAACKVDPASDPSDNFDCASGTAPASGIRRITYTYCEAADVAAPGSNCPILGLLRSINGPRDTTDSGMGGLDDTTTLTYYPSTDESGCGTLGGTCHRKGDLWKVTNALGHVDENVAYDKNGRLVRSKDANGTITDTAYHARGWVLSRTVRANANGGASADDATTTFAYDDAGNATRVTQPDGAYLNYAYDDAHRLTDVVDSLGNRIHYTLDADGNRVKEQTYDSSYNAASPSNGLMREMSRVYNQLSRLTKTLNASNAATRDSTSFDSGGLTDGYDGAGNSIQFVDGLGVKTKKEYDPLNRLTKTLKDYLGTNPETADTATSYAYDTRDNFRSITDPDGLTTTYTYDGLNNLVALDSPDTGHSARTFDKAGNPVSVVDSRGIASNFTYDALNRSTSASYPTSGLNVTLSYDEPDSVTGCSSSHPIGRLTRMSDASGTTVYCYDRRGNLIHKAQGTSPTLTVAYTYTKSDRVATMTYPSGAVVTYARDGAGRVIGVNWAANASSAPMNVIGNVTYYPFGPSSIVTFGNGRSLTKTYDSNYAIDSVVSSASDGLVLDFTTDVMGNIVAGHNAVGASAPTRKYVYDPLERLTRVDDANDAMLEDYGYDKAGDRTLKQLSGQSPTSYTYLSGTHRLGNAGGANRTYDAAGNMTDRGDGIPLVYDDRNRLASVGSGSSIANSYVYNGKGERVANQLGSFPASAKTLYLHEGEQLLAARTYSAAGAQTREIEYVYIGAIPIAQVTDGVLSYLETDQMGTPRIAFDPVTNARLWSWDYFGSAFGDNAATPAAGGIDVVLRYPGQMYDPETQTHYNYQRSYEPQTGRYTQSDPIGLNGGVNTYRYAYANPLRYFDPNGLQACGTILCLPASLRKDKVGDRLVSIEYRPFFVEEHLSSETPFGGIPNITGMTRGWCQITKVMKYEELFQWTQIISCLEVCGFCENKFSWRDHEKVVDTSIENRFEYERVRGFRVIDYFADLVCHRAAHEMH